MAKSQLKEIFASLESEEEQLPEERTEIVGGVDSMENDMMEVAEAYDEVEGVEEDIEEMEEIAEGMESLRDALAASLESGGLDTQSAVMTRLALGSYTTRLGLEADKVLPSLESFGGDSGRLSATQVSMESIGETLKKIWAAVRAAVERAIKAISDFFAKIFGATKKVKERAEALRKEVQALEKDGAKPEGEMSVPGANTLGMEGKADIKTITEGLGNLVEVSGQIATMADGADEYYAEAAKKVIELKDKDEAADAEAASTSLWEKAKAIFAKVEKHEGKLTSGNYTIVSTAKGESTEVAVNFTRSEKAKAVQDTKIATPDAKTLVGICDDVIKLVETLEKTEKAVSDAKKAREAAVKAASDVVKASERNAVGKVWTNQKAQSVLRAAQKDMLRPLTQSASHVFAVSRSALGLVEVAKKNFKKEEKAAA